LLEKQLLQRRELVENSFSDFGGQPACETFEALDNLEQ
jgi:hypothetical protein